MSASRRRPFWVWIVIGTPILLLSLVLIGVWQAKLYLHGDGFRKFLSSRVSRNIKAVGEFDPLAWTGSSFYSEKYAAKGKVGAKFQEIEADQFRADVNLRGLWEKKWLVEAIQIERLAVKLGPGTEPEAILSRPKEVENKKPSNTPGWLPNRVELRKINIAKLDLDGSALEKSAFTAKGLNCTAEPDGNAWKIATSGGKIQYAGWSPLTLGESQLRYAERTLFITGATATSETGGNLTVTGQIGFDQPEITRLAWKIDALPAESVLPEDWRAKLHGKLYGNLDVTPAPGRPAEKGVTATGHIELKEGQLEAIPVLEQIAAFTRTQRFRQLPLDQVRGDIDWRDGVFTVTNFNAESPGLVRLTGQFTVKGKKLDGDFYVGLTPGSLRWIPGSQESVFTISKEGYLWTPMKVTGSLKHPKEDLSERLAIAAGQNLFKQLENNPDKAKETLKDAAKALIDLLGK